MGLACFCALRFTREIKVFFVPFGGSERESVSFGFPFLSDCEQTSVYCVIIEVSIFLLFVDLRSFSASKDCQHSLSPDRIKCHTRHSQVQFGFKLTMLQLLITAPGGTYIVLV